MERAEVMFTELENHKVLKHGVAHHELLSGTANVAVVVKKTHSGETSAVNLEGDVQVHVEVRVDLTGGVEAGGRSVGEVVETLVSDFINHFNYYILQPTLLIETKMLSRPFKTYFDTLEEIEIQRRKDKIADDLCLMTQTAIERIGSENFVREAK